VIAFLRGEVIAKQPNGVTLDVGGVGYALNVPPSLAASVSKGDALSLHVSLILREDSATLYGFSDSEEKSLFELMLSVSGVGPRSAWQWLVLCSSAEIANAVGAQNDEMFRKVPGIGPKTAKLITVSLAGKFEGVALEGASTIDSEVLQALQGLGYNEKQAVGAIKKVGTRTSTAEVLKAALQILSER